MNEELRGFIRAAEIGKRPDESTSEAVVRSVFERIEREAGAIQGVEGSDVAVSMAVDLIKHRFGIGG